MKDSPNTNVFVRSVNRSREFTSTVVIPVVVDSVLDHPKKVKFFISKAGAIYIRRAE